MQKEDIEYITPNTPVKIAFKTNTGRPFFLVGIILRVSDDCIVFKTDQKTSILPIDTILEVKEM